MGSWFWLILRWLWRFGWSDTRSTRDGLQSRSSSLGRGTLTALFGLLGWVGTAIANRHDEEFARDRISQIGELNGAGRERITRGNVVTSNSGVLDNGAKILDGDDDVEVILDINIVKLIYFQRNCSSEGFL